MTSVIYIFIIYKAAIITISSFGAAVRPGLVQPQRREHGLSLPWQHRQDNAAAAVDDLLVTVRDLDTLRELCGQRARPRYTARGQGEPWLLQLAAASRWRGRGLRGKARQRGVRHARRLHKRARARTERAQHRIRSAPSSWRAARSGSYCETGATRADV